MKKMLVSAILFQAWVSACGVSDQRSVPDAEASISGAVVVGVASAVSSSSGEWQPVYVGQEFSQSVSYGADVFPGDHGHLELMNMTFSQASGEWTSQVYSFNASFEIALVASAKRDRLYVLGKTAGGQCVIERWKKGNGGLIGGGGGYVMQRTELYRSDSLGEISWIGADPAERYLLVLHSPSPETHVLSQMDLPSGQPVQAVWDATQIPNLQYVTGGYPRNHQTQGRLWVLSVFGAEDRMDPLPRRTILYDDQNDGVLDSHVTVDEGTWEAMGYTQDVWAGDFVIDLGW